MTIRYHVFASKSFLENNGIPKTVADLDSLPLIVYGDEVPAPVDDINWLLTAGRRVDDPREPTFRVNSIHGIYRAVLSGLGVAALPYYLSEESSYLQEILPYLKGPTIEAYFVYPEELRHSKRIEVLRDFLLDEVRVYNKSIK